MISCFLDQLEEDSAFFLTNLTMDAWAMVPGLASAMLRFCL